MTITSRLHSALALVAFLVALIFVLPASSVYAQSGVGTVSNEAGTVFGFEGDGGPARFAKFSGMEGVSIDPEGGLLIADTGNNRVRRIAPDGTVATVAGSNLNGAVGDGGPATSAGLDSPNDTVITADGGFLVADTQNHRIRKVAPNGTITTVAGTTLGFGGDGGPATAAQLRNPQGVAVHPDGGFIVADTGNNRVRRVFPDGHIETIAGLGVQSPATGDGGAAVAAGLNSPRGVAVEATGDILISDSGNHRVRRVLFDRTPASADNLITTAAGTVQGLSGDGGPATAGRLNSPRDITALPEGGFLVADSLNHRVRRVERGGTLFTVAGTSEGDPTGDGGSSTSAKFRSPDSVALAQDGGFLVADTGNARVRRVTVPGAIKPPLLGRVSVVVKLRGNTFVDPPGSPAVRLPGAANVAMGTVLNASAGVIEVRTAADRSGVPVSAEVSEDLARMTQGADLVTTFRLTRRLAPCPRPKPRPRSKDGLEAGQSPAKLGGRRSRRFFVRARGRYRTRGAYGSAIVRGTEWFTTDDCRGTTIRVREGVVGVTANAGGGEVLVRAGQSRLIRRPLPR